MLGGLARPGAGRRMHRPRAGAGDRTGGLIVEWIYLALAILFEVVGTVSLKLSDGLTRLVPALVVAPAYLASFALLALTLKTMPVSVAYAIWAALGTALVAVVGIVYFREAAGVLKLACLALIIVGVVGLHLSDRLAAAS